MPSVYDIGDTVRVTGEFTSTAGAPTNPTTVTFWVKAPTTTVLAVASPSTAIVNPTTGTFFLDYLPLSSGVYGYRVFSTGTIVTAEEGMFRVRTPIVAST